MSIGKNIEKNSNNINKRLRVDGCMIMRIDNQDKYIIKRERRKGKLGMNKNDQNKRDTYNYHVTIGVLLLCFHHIVYVYTLKIEEIKNQE